MSTKSKVPPPTRSSLRQKRSQRLRLLKRRMTEVMLYHGWHRSNLGVEIGYSRSTVANVILGYMPPAPEFITRIDLVYDQMVMERIARKTILSRHALPKRLVINEDFGRCDVCHWHFVRVNKKQKRCSDECRRYARRFMSKRRKR